MCVCVKSQHVALEDLKCPREMILLTGKEVKKPLHVQKIIVKCNTSLPYIEVHISIIIISMKHA